jgi:hypothetical protein
MHVSILVQRNDLLKFPAYVRYQTNLISVILITCVKAGTAQCDRPQNHSGHQSRDGSEPQLQLGLEVRREASEQRRGKAVRR